ncbi:hypothetical protein [Reyranella sp.]|uniref:hypothetical protein n=1 Tax=Reyranella sp. TaxID=1929291 RepID=UPI003BA9B64A
MGTDEIWMGRPIDDMTRDELAAALKAASRLLRSAPPVDRPEMTVRQTGGGTTVGRAFNWAFMPAGHLWTEEDRAAIQCRLDAFAGSHGLDGATVHFAPDRLDVEVPRPLAVEQVWALQQWLEAEGETLDVSQVP